MDTKTTRFRLIGASPTESEELMGTILRQIKGDTAGSLPIDLTLEPESDQHQDLGTILAVVLAGPAVVSVARVFANWITERGYGLEMKLPSGETITLKNADRETVEQTIRSHGAS